MLKTMGAAGSSFVLLKNKKLHAQTSTETPFLLYIHCGSWDGESSNLVQPQKANQWAKGQFYRAQEGQSANPLVNDHTTSGSLVFHKYNSFMKDLADQMCFTVANAQSVSHFDARSIRQSGEKPGAGGLSWLAGFAQACANKIEKSNAVVNTPLGYTRNYTNVAKDIKFHNSLNLANYYYSSKDNADVPKGENANAYWQKLASLHTQNLNTTLTRQDIRKNFSDYVSQLVAGIPQFAPNSNLVADVTNKISWDAISQIIRAQSGLAPSEAQKIIDYGPNGVGSQYIEQLQVAAALAKTNVAQAMSISLTNQDLHNPTEQSRSSSVSTARRSSIMWAGVKALWSWIEANGLQQKVMIVISHARSL